MRYLIGTILVSAMFLFSAYAAEITPSGPAGVGHSVITWENVTSGDTTGAATYRGGSAVMFTSGTQATADFEFQYDPEDGTNWTDVNSSLASAGGYRYTSATGLGYINCFTLPPGKVRIVYNSAGSSTQDLEHRFIPVPSCP